MKPWQRRFLLELVDLHSANLIVAGGAITAVLDLGDLTSGDPAVDLAVAWMLFDVDDRCRFRIAAGAARPSTTRRGTAPACGASTSL